MLSQQVIASFWEWFARSIPSFESILAGNDDPRVLASITAEIKNLSEGLGWEIGPGIEKENQFVLSPNRSKERLAITRSIVQDAPCIKQWEIHPFKPRKKWNRRLEMPFEGDGISIDFSNWRYSLTAFSRRQFFDIDLYPDSQLPCDQHVAKSMATLFVESEIGEDLLIERIDRVNVHRAEEATGIEGLSRSGFLYDHLLSLLPIP